MLPGCGNLRTVTLPSGSTDPALAARTRTSTGSLSRPPIPFGSPTHPPTACGAIAMWSVPTRGRASSGLEVTLTRRCLQDGKRSCRRRACLKELSRDLMKPPIPMPSRVSSLCAVASTTSRQRGKLCIRCMTVKQRVCSVFDRSHAVFLTGYSRAVHWAPLVRAQCTADPPGSGCPSARQATVVLPLLAGEDRLHRRLRVHRRRRSDRWRTAGNSSDQWRKMDAVVDPTRAGAPEEGEGPVMGVEHRSHRGAIGPSPMAEAPASRACRLGRRTSGCGGAARGRPSPSR